MKEIHDFEPIWPNWVIDEKLGQGSYGTVWKAHREDPYSKIVQYSAVKHISIPRDENDDEDIVFSDRNSANVYYTETLTQLIQEIDTMIQLRGTPNIVSYEEHSIVPKEDRAGFDLFLRMELLTPLTVYARQHNMDREQVIRLGVDIARALEVLQERQLIHRDIKPANVFVDDKGQFKLGDFGTARAMEREGNASTHTGTPNYMAPEVYTNSRNYNQTVDIYSLGIMLYRYLNHGYLPFCSEKTPSTETALVRRVSGQEALPSPCSDDPVLAAVVLKACAYRSENRYQTAKELRQALEALQRGEEAESDDKTIKIEQKIEIIPGENPKPQEAAAGDGTVENRKTRNAQPAAPAAASHSDAAPKPPVSPPPAPPSPPAPPAGNPARGKEPKPHRFSRVILILAVVAVLLAAGYLLYSYITQNASSPVLTTPTNSPVPAETPTVVLTVIPTEVPTEVPTAVPTEAPTAVPTEVPTEVPTAVPIERPTAVPTEVPTAAPTTTPSLVDIVAKANEAYNRHNFEEAAEMYLYAAELGNDEAQFRLGWLYENGYGVEQNYEKSIEWYQKAAELGNAGAFNNLGWLYENGYGVEQSYEKAAEWYQKAADLGNSDAINNVGYLYENGLGVQKSDEIAAQYYEKAAENGNMFAQYNIGCYYYFGTGVKQNTEKAIEWLQKAADQGHTEAQDMLTEIQSRISGMKVVSFGTYRQGFRSDNGKEDISWVVLDTFDDGRMLLISQYILAQEPFNESFSRTEWEKCTLRTWLNDDFLNDAFSPDEQAQMTEQQNGDLVILLSEEEAKKYESTLMQLEEYTPSAAFFRDFHDGKNYDAWWLRTSGNQTSRAKCVKMDSVNGLSMAIRQVDAETGVRPVICIRTKQQ